MRKGQSFIMDTAGHCFLCLERWNKSGDDGSKLFAFQNICQYVNLSLKEVLVEETMSASASPSSSAVTSLEELELMGTVCEECTQLATTFSKDFLELQMLQMRVQSSLKSIYDRMVMVEVEGEERAGKDKKVLEEEFKKEMFKRPRRRPHYRIVEKLRRRAIEKCSRKLSPASPAEVINDIDKLNDSSSEIVSENEGDDVDDIKLEESPPPNSSSGLTLPPAENEQDHQPNEFLVECSICHSKVSDLFQHLQTANCEILGAAGGGSDPEELVEVPVSSPPPSQPEVGHDPSGKPSYKCDLCENSYQLRSSLLRHRRLSHSTEKHDQGKTDMPAPTPSIPGNSAALTYACSICTASFPTLPGFQKHVKAKHVHPRRGTGRYHTPATCNICGQVFASKSYMLVHQRSVHGIRDKGQGQSSSTNNQQKKKRELDDDDYDGTERRKKTAKILPNDGEVEGEVSSDPDTEPSSSSSKKVIIIVKSGNKTNEIKEEAD